MDKILEVAVLVRIIGAEPVCVSSQLSKLYRVEVPLRSIIASVDLIWIEQLLNDMREEGFARLTTFIPDVNTDEPDWLSNAQF